MFATTINKIKQKERIEGKKEGKKEGKREGKVLAAKNMFKMGLDLEFIAKATELSSAELKKILKEE
ncbi:MAG: hypothetical protein CVV50_01420 [Spirochaetae bacterium HGW-Spirochaetae-6]|nr:MAG: hypothetical protein CVV50_01420 [Spirochaetae bacterium HGW-Spirochaetae-6]